MKKFIQALLLTAFCCSFAARPLMAAGTLSCERFGTEFFALEERKVTVTIDEGIVFTEVEDSFRNGFEDVTEGIYKFGLPENSIPCGFEMMTDGKEWITGKAMDLRKAKLIYQEIVARSTDPGLMTIKNSALKIRIFPIVNKLPVKVRFRFISAMTSDEFILPVEKAPHSSPDGIMNEALLKGPDARPEGKFSISITARDSGTITKLECAGVSGTEENQVFKLSAGASGLPEKPEKILIARKNDPLPGKSAAFKAKDGTAVAVVTAVPSAYPGAPPAEAEAVIDASGSMGNNNKKRALKFIGALSKCFRNLKYSLIKEDALLEAPAIADIEKADFFGGDPAGITAHIAALNGPGPLFILTDGLWLNAGMVERIQKTAGGRKVIFILFHPDPDRTLIRAAGKRGCAARYSDLEKEGLSPGAIQKLAVVRNAFIKTGGALIPPLFSDASGAGGVSLFAVKFDENSKAPYQLTDGNGSALGDIAAPESCAAPINDGMPKKLIAAAAVRTLELKEQTDETIADIVKLGVENGLVTNYTAYIAIPPAEAERNSDVLNPAFIGAFAPPNFNRARSQAKVKSCVSNMKTIEGALELYSMENGSVPDPGAGTLNAPVETLQGKGYLKTVPKCPTAWDGHYKMMRTGSPEGVSGCELFCEAHGFLSNFDLPERKSAEDQFRDKCAEYGIDPEAYPIKFITAEGFGGSELFEEWLRKNLIFIYILDAFLK